MDNFIIFKQDWDSKFFEINCAKLILNESISLADWDIIKNKIDLYDFVVIENRNSNPINSYIIGLNSKAFLADVNIQFEQNTYYSPSIYDNVLVTNNSFDDLEEILRTTNFSHSRFFDDPLLIKRGGKEIYNEWIRNSIHDTSKFFVLYREENGLISGFILISQKENNTIIELISVSKLFQNKGIGHILINAVNNFSYRNNNTKIYVGTQFRNIQAINFYFKNGFKQIQNNEIYHLWNKFL